MSEEREVATLGGGCFWCLEAIFSRLIGVTGAVPGYSGGHVDHPGYEAVCTGETGHAEVVQVTFDPSVASFDEILAVFFSIHDPTSLNRQGNDIGTQYRSVIFFHSDAQKESAEKAIEAASRHSDHPIVTEVAPIEVFHPAEEYHWHYFDRNRNQPYCRFAIEPKLGKFMEKFPGRLKP
jgi:peptide-methionine (S)-S-oxide reductase